MLNEKFSGENTNKAYKKRLINEEEGTTKELTAGCFLLIWPN